MPAKVEKDEQNRKIFIGGITVNTSDEDLRTFYSKWGEITDVVVMRDPVSKRSRGFGFVTYADPEQVNAAMAARPHLIDGKEVEPKRAMPKDVMNKPEAHISVKKVYISGIKDEHTEDMLREYFMQYGSVQEVDIKVDQGTGKKRGFAFVTFDDYDPVDRVVLEKSHMIDNKRCDVKKALSKEEMKRIQQQDFDRQQRDARSRGMMRGGYTPNRSMGDMGMPYGGASSRWSGGHGGNMAGNHGGWADHSWGGSYVQVLGVKAVRNGKVAATEVEVPVEACRRLEMTGGVGNSLELYLSRNCSSKLMHVMATSSLKMNR
ncbi:Heterogeneous nuclear ribonucleoprotein [Trichinella spiralis]|uniref:Heterogeneous nuclear ribonucleoprotein n=1 Tax=Trichinella spiralis TaxID=6334 RepID=A0ABR3KEQ5_TRISP